MTQPTQEIQQLKEQLASETRLKAEAQETSLTEVKEENMSLKKDMEEHEENWKNRVETAEKKLAEIEKIFNSFKQLLTDIVAAVWGKFPSSFLCAYLSMPLSHILLT